MSTVHGDTGLSSEPLLAAVLLIALAVWTAINWMKAKHLK